MTLNDLKRLVKLLGPAGAKAGIRASDMERDVLASIAAKSNIDFPADGTRDDVIDRLVSGSTNVALKPMDDLLIMPYDDLIQYFNEVSPSTDDLMKIMKDLNYKVGAEDKKHLRRFVARQISETALFSSVARRGKDDTKKP